MLRCPNHDSKNSCWIIVDNLLQSQDKVTNQMMERSNTIGKDTIPNPNSIVTEFLHGSKQDYDDENEIKMHEDEISPEASRIAKTNYIGLDVFDLNDAMSDNDGIISEN